MSEKSAKQSFNLIKDMYPNYAAYFAYFQATWLDGQFSPNLWNISDKFTNQLSHTLKHSTNQIESFHTIPNYELSKSNEPQLEEVVEGLKHIEAKTMLDLNLCEEGEVVKVRFLRLINIQYRP